MPRGLENKGDRGSFFEGEILGIRQAIYLGRTNEFSAAAVDHVAQVGELAAVIVLAGNASRAFSAGYAGRENDFLADAYSSYLGPPLGDFSRHIAARTVRKRTRNSTNSPPHP